MKHFVNGTDQLPGRLENGAITSIRRHLEDYRHGQNMPANSKRTYSRDALTAPADAGSGDGVSLRFVHENFVVPRRVFLSKKVCAFGGKEADDDVVHSFEIPVGSGSASEGVDSSLIIQDVDTCLERSP